MKPFKISIILPVYNVEAYLESCLTSLLSQTLKDIEIVAVNDGSTDCSLQILERFQSIYPNQLFIYTTENHGVSHARNYGFSRARGEYVWFVDSDDFVEPDACEKLYAKAVKDGNDLVLFSYYNVNAATGEKQPFPVSHHNQNFRLSDKPYEMSIISPYPWIKFIKYELFEGLAFPEGIRFEDLPIAYLLAAKAQSVGVVKECLYNYRKNVGFLNSLTPSTLDIKKAVLYLDEKMSALGYREQYQTELDFITIRHFFFRFWKLLTNYETEKKALKLQLINELYDYIEERIPDWKNNHYVKYSLPAHLFRMLYLYGSRSELTAFVEACDGMDPETQKRWIKDYKARKENSQPCPAFHILCRTDVPSHMLFCTESLYPLANANHRTCCVNTEQWQRRMLTADLLVFPDKITRKNYLQGTMLENICQTPCVTLDSWDGTADNNLKLTKADTEYLSDHCPSAFYPKPERRTSIRKALGISADASLFLCCPQMPGKDASEAFQSYRRFVSGLYQLDCGLLENQVLYLSLCAGENIDCSGFKHIRLLPAEYDIYDFANACDTFISDFHPGMKYLAENGQTVIRFLCSGNEYIENKALDYALKQSGVLTCTNIPELAALISSQSDRAAALHTMDISKPVLPEAPDARIRVLYYTGKKLNRKLVEEFSSFALEHPEREYWLAVSNSSRAESLKPLRFLANGCHFLALESDRPKSSAWKAAGLLITRAGLSAFYPTKHVLSLGKAECAHYLGNVAFDEVIITSTNNLQTVAALLNAAPSASCTMDTFCQEKYKTTRSYRHQIQFLRRLLKTAGAQVNEAVQNEI